MNKHFRKVQALWSTPVHFTVQGRIFTSSSGSAAISLWVEMRILKAALMQGPFYASLSLMHTYPYSYTVCECVPERESCHVVSQSTDWFDPPPC